MVPGVFELDLTGETIVGHQPQQAGIIGEKGVAISARHLAPSRRPREQIKMTIIDRYALRLSGYAPAVPTPFDGNGNIDSAAFEQFCDRQVQEGRPH